MIDRKLIKEEAKKDFKLNYWKTVLVSFIFSCIVGGSVSASGRGASDGAASKTGEMTYEQFKAMYAQDPKAFTIVIAAIIGIFLLISLIFYLFRIFVINPLGMGCNAFFLKNTEDRNTEIGELKKGFVPYMRNVVSLLLKDIYVFLWALLLIIPGIVKSYSYALTPYILAEDPNISAKDAITKSKEMMKGHRMEAFKLDLSFLGWIILSILTLGLLYIFYVGPYMFQADAEFYKRVKELNA